MEDRRNLTIKSYIHGIPESGICKRCQAHFRVEQSLVATPQKAIEKFYADFDTHKCKPKREDASQADVRIVREATEDH